MVYLTRVDGVLIENSFENYVTRTIVNDNIEYTIDIEGQAIALVGESGTSEDYKKAEDLLARNIGIKTSTDVSGELNLTYAITTEDRNNPEVDGQPDNKTQSINLTIDVKNINDLAFIDQTTISNDSTYFQNTNLPFLLHKDAIVKDKESHNFFGGFLMVSIASIAGEIMASERIVLNKDSLFSMSDVKLLLGENEIGTIDNTNEFNGLKINFDESGTTSLEIINNLIKDLEFYAPEIMESGKREISLTLNDGGGTNEFGENETVITRNLNLFVGKSGTLADDNIDGDNIDEEALIGGLGQDTLIGGEGDYIDLQLEKEFFDLYSSQAIAPTFYNQVNLGIDNTDTTSDLAIIQSKLNNIYNPDIAIDYENNYNEATGFLTISNFKINEVDQDISTNQVYFVEEMNGYNNNDISMQYSSETSLSDFITVSGDSLVIDIVGKAKELLAGVKSYDVTYNRQIQNILGEDNDNVIGNKELNKIVENIKSNLIIKNKINMEDDFVNAGTMVLNGTDEIDQIVDIKNIKGSEYEDHILGSKEDNLIDGRSGNDVIYGGAGNDTILGGAGDDIISGGAGNDYIDGGLGDDTIYVSSGLNVIDAIGQTIIGGKGNDTLSFENINNGVLLDFVFGIGTFDEVDALGAISKNGDGIGEVIYFVLEGETYHSFEKIIGSEVNDYIVNLTPWDHFMEIFGGQGNDTLIGSYGNELISGGAGNDFISGGYGVDTLIGGEGFDTFIILDDTPDQDFKDQWNLKNPEDESITNADNIFKSEDIIKDFEIGVDTLDLSAIVRSGADLSGNIETNDLSIKNKDNNNFDALMEIKNANFDVSITLENFFRLNSEQTEAELLQSILV